MLSNADSALFDTDTAPIPFANFYKGITYFEIRPIFDFKGHPYQNAATHLKYETKLGSAYDTPISTL